MANKSYELMSPEQPLNLPEVALSATRHPTLAVGTCNLSRGLGANKAYVLSDLAMLVACIR